MPCLTRPLLLALTLGILTTIALAWAIALRPQHTFTFTSSIPFDSAPDGQPSYIENAYFSDEYRPAFTRIVLKNNPYGLDSLRLSRIRRYVEANDLTPPSYDGGQPLWPARRPRWPGWLPTDPGLSHTKQLEARASGWPFLCLSSHAAQSGSVRESTGELRIFPTTAYSAGSWRISSTDPDLGTVPLIPFLPGFALNTALFTTLWCAIILPLRALRAHLRRGLCPRCAYDLRATPPDSPCPECGTLSR